MKQFLHTYKINGEFHYAVYNGQGALALWTRSLWLAERYARDFATNPRSTEIRVADLPPRSPKRH